MTSPKSVSGTSRFSPINGRERAFLIETPLMTSFSKIWSIRSYSSCTSSASGCSGLLASRTLMQPRLMHHKLQESSLKLCRQHMPLTGIAGPPNLVAQPSVLPKTNSSGQIAVVCGVGEQTTLL